MREPKVCLCHYSYYYCYFINWTSFKTHLIWAYLKFHYTLLFRSTSATIPEPKFSSSTFSSYPISLWQCMLFLVRQSFLPTLNYSIILTQILYTVFWLRSCEKAIWNNQWYTWIIFRKCYWILYFGNMYPRHKALTLFRMGATGGWGGEGAKRPTPYHFFPCNFYKCRT